MRKLSVIKLFIGFCCISFINKSFAQHQEREVLLYNVSLGAITSGIGSVINKPAGVNWRKAFVRGVWQGSIGGMINYSSKKTLYLINKKQSSAYALPAKILHSAGASIIENAALHRPFLENWNIDYGPIRFDFSLHGKNFKARLLPQTIYAAIRAGQYGKFNLGESLPAGVMIFKTGNYLERLGMSYGRALIYSHYPGYPKNSMQLLAHEIVHTYQYRDYQALNTWLKPLEKKVTSKTVNKIFSRYIYFDAPYFGAFYPIEGYHGYYSYFRNFYEFEAERFSTNARVFNR